MHKAEWKRNEVIFELLKKGNSTRINFTHIGLIPVIKCYEKFEEGWTERLTISLVKFINEGEGNRE